MIRRQMKARAKYLIFHTKPHPFLVTLIVLVFFRLISLLTMRIGGQPFVIDTAALTDPAALAEQGYSIIQFVPENATMAGTLFLIVFEILSLIVNYGYFSYSLRVVKGESAGYINLLDGFTVAIRAIIATLLTGLLVFFGTILFIIPGLILALNYALTPLVLMDHPDWSALECMRESRRLMRGHRWEYFVLKLSFIGWFLLTVFPVFSIFVEPYVQFTDAIFYLRLAYPEKESWESSSGAPTEEKPPWEY